MSSVNPFIVIMKELGWECSLCMSLQSEVTGYDNHELLSVILLMNNREVVGE